MVRIVNLKRGAWAASWWAKPNGIVLVEVNSFLSVVHSEGDLTYSFAFHIGDHFYSCWDKLLTCNYYVDFHSFVVSDPFNYS